MAVTAELGNRSSLHVTQKLRTMVKSLGSWTRCAFVLNFASVTFLAGQVAMHGLGKLVFMA